MMKIVKPLLLAWIDMFEVIFRLGAVQSILAREKLNIEVRWVRAFRLQSLIVCFVMIASLAPMAFFVRGSYLSLVNHPEYKGKVLKTLATRKKPMPTAVKSDLELALFFVGFYVISNLFLYSTHQVLVKSRKLAKLKLNEKHPNLVRLWLPVGVYMDTYGEDAKNIANDETIWAAMDMVVDKDMIYESAKKRTMKLFVSSFELQDKYIYDDANPKA